MKNMYDKLASCMAWIPTLVASFWNIFQLLSLVWWATWLLHVWRLLNIQLLFISKYVWKYDLSIKVDNGIFICASSVWSWIIFRAFSLMCSELHGMWLGISLSYDKWTTRVVAHLGLIYSMLIMLQTNLQRVCRILWSLLLMQQIVIKILGLGNRLYLCGKVTQERWRVLKSFLLCVSSFVLTYNAGQFFHFKPWEPSNVTKILECHGLECCGYIGLNVSPPQR